MSATEILEQIRALPLEEQRELVNRIEQEFFDDNALSPEQIAELDRRAEDALKNPGRGTPIDKVSADIRERFLAKK